MIYWLFLENLFTGFGIIHFGAQTQLTEANCGSDRKR